MLNKKPNAKTFVPVVFAVFLLLAPLLAQTCSAKPIQAQEDKAMSFLRDVIQLDVDHYKFTLDYNSTDTYQNSLYLEYKVEPKTFAFWESYTMNFQFCNDTLISFSVQPGSDNSLVYAQPRSDRFNEVLGILTRYQAWVNDSQVGEFADLMRQVGSERSLLQASGNISLHIQQYSDTAEYRFSNYINGVEYTSIGIAEGNSTGGVHFSDNRATQEIGNTTINISQDQAVAIAQNYVDANPVRGSVPEATGIMNLNVTGIKGVSLKSMERENGTLYPYYDVEFSVEQPSTGLQGYGVNVGANDGVIWGAYSYSSSTSTSTPAFIPNILVIILVTILGCAAVIIGVYESRLRFNVRPDTV